jgi:hypothetical protein
VEANAGLLKDWLNSVVRSPLKEPTGERFGNTAFRGGKSQKPGNTATFASPH